MTPEATLLQRLLSPERAVLLMVVVSGFALPLMLSSVNVALPSVARALKMDAILLSWVPLVFLTTSAATVLAFGRLADLIGRKRVFTLGTLGIIVSSILAACAPNAGVLLGLRAAQGLTAAMLYSTQIGLVSSVVPPQQRGQAIGMVVSAVYFGLTCGPVIGGWLIEHIGWRAAFVAHVPLALIVLIFFIPRVKGEWKAETPGRFDYAGAALYAVAITAMMVGGAALPKMLGAALLAVGVLGMWLFFRHQHGRTDPIFDVNLFYTNRVFTLSSLASLLMYATTYSTLVLVSLYLQYLKGLRPMQAGMVMLAQPLMSALISPLAGRLSDTVIEPRVIATLGILLTGIGLTMLSALEPLTPLSYVTSCLILTGIGFSLFSSPNASAIMSTVDKRAYGAAGGAVATMRVLGQLASMAIVAIAFALTIGPVEIEPSTYLKLAQALDLSFMFAAVLCIPAMLCSLARGRVR